MPNVNPVPGDEDDPLFVSRFLLYNPSIGTSARGQLYVKFYVADSDKMAAIAMTDYADILLECVVRQRQLAPKTSGQEALSRWDQWEKQLEEGLDAEADES